MHRIITGATGLIGKRLVNHWLSQHHIITVIGRTKEHIEAQFGTKVQAVTWAHLSKDLLRSAEVVVNLAGANIGAKHWTPSRKEEVLHSRVDTTKQLAALLVQLGREAPALFNASAVGIYGLQEQHASGLPPRLDEDTKIDWDNPPDFLSQVGRAWERAAMPAVTSGVRVVFLRFGVVLAKEGGALPQLARPFQLFVGGPIGTGNQPFSWVAIDDVIESIDFLISKPNTSGPFNIVAPECVQQHKLAETIAQVMNRPAFVPMPAFVMKLMLGDEMARDLLLEGQHAYPKRLLELGFKFNYPDILSALKHLLK